MSGTLLLARAEIGRLRRNKRYLIFTVALPVFLYLIFANSPRFDSHNFYLSTEGKILRGLLPAR